MSFRAKRSLGVPLGLSFIGLVVAFDAWLFSHLLNHDLANQQINFLSFLLGLLILLSIPPLAVLVYQTLNCATLRYRVDRNGIMIQWGGSRRILPIREIKAIVPGSQVEGQIVRRRGLRWRGYERGEGRLRGVGRVHFLATRPLAEQLLIVLPGQAFGISPRDPAGFVSAFEARRELGPNRLLDPEVRRARWLQWPLWTDRVARTLLGSALLVNVGLFGYLSARFPGLDLQLPLHFNTLGEADRIAPKTDLFGLPIIGLIILCANLVLGLALYRRERAGSYLLWGAATAAQVLFWLAAFSLVP